MGMKKDHSPLDCLSRADIFKNLPTEMKQELVTVSTHQEFFAKGSLIRQPNDGRDGMLVIDSGHAKIYSLDESGKEIVLGTMAAGDSEGQERLFSAESRESFIQATTDTLVCSINRCDFQNLLQRSPNLAIGMLNDFGQRLITVERQIVRRNSLEAKERILAYLRDLSRAQGSASVVIPLRKKDLASLLGIAPETFSRKLRELEAEGCIKKAEKNVVVLL